MAQAPRPRGLPEPPKPVEETGAVDRGRLQDLNFKVEPAFHRRVKVTASRHGKTMVEIFREAFELWTERYGE